MKSKIIASLKVETLKIRRSTIFLITVCACVFIALMIGLMMLLIMNPNILPPGLLKTKISVAAVTANWPAYFSLFEQAGGAIGIILFGFIASWTFGREFTDRTLKDLLAISAPRSAIVYGKFAAMFLWSAVLAVVMYLTGLLIGTLIHLPLWSGTAFADFNRVFFISIFLSTLLSPAVSLIASAGRGPLPAIGFILLCMGLANFFGTIGWGAYFPWSIPMLFTGAVGGPGSQLHIASYVILSATFLAGVAGTVLYWKFADHNK
jgi:ABC-2 type transport system permease protein